MAKAQQAQQARQHGRKPYSQPAGGSRATTTMPTTSVSKLKASLRSAKRLLAKPHLDARLRVDTERRVESLEAELAEIRQQQDSRNGPAEDANASSTAASISNGTIVSKKKQKKDKAALAKQNEKRQGVYKMLKHVEYQKTARRVKSARRALDEVQTQLQNLAEDASIASSLKDSKKARRKLEKELAARQEDLVRARVDAWYVATFPESKKYVSLFPSGEFREHEAPATQPDDRTTEEDLLASFPSSKKPDEVRNFWRAVVRARLEDGRLEGEPVKEKKKKQKKGSKAGMETSHGSKEDQADGSTASDADSDDDDVESEQELESAQESEASDVSTEDDENVGQAHRGSDVDLDEDKDDFFA